METFSSEILRAVSLMIYIIVDVKIHQYESEMFFFLNKRKLKYISVRIRIYYVLANGPILKLIIEVDYLYR